jgi:two-component sensor histidine kinase
VSVGKRWWWVALGLWTVFVALALWWLFHSEPGQPATTWTVQGGEDTSFWARTRDWFRMMHLNFQRIYPWILFAPYVLWLTSRFHLERERLALRLAVQLAGCAIFAGASHAINSHILTTTRIVVVNSHSDIRTAGLPDREKQLVHVEVAGAGAAPLLDEREIVTSYHTQMVVRVPGGAGTGAFSAVGASDPATLKFMPTNLIARLEQAMKPGVSSAGVGLRPLATVLDVLAYGALAGMAHAVHFYRRYRERERRALFLESNLTKARLHALQAQLQPHFLFNTLNAIATLLRRDVRAAENTLMSLSDLLRLALSRSQEQEIPLREELRFLERYVQIQQTRFGERLKFELEAENGTLDCLVPTLMLQPVVENAIQHGIEPTGNSGVVRVSGHRTGERLTVQVQDNGAGIPETPSPNQNGGIGLSNLRQRLEALYGSEHKLEIISRAEGGTNVCIEIPWHTTAARGAEADHQP